MNSHALLSFDQYFPSVVVTGSPTRYWICTFLYDMFFFLKNSQLNTTCIPSIFFTILCFELTYLSVCKLDFKRKKYHVTYMYHRIHNQKLTVVNEYATEWYRIIWRTNEANRLSYLQPMHLNMLIGTYKFEF